MCMDWTLGCSIKSMMPARLDLGSRKPGFPAFFERTFRWPSAIEPLMICGTLFGSGGTWPVLGLQNCKFLGVGFWADHLLGCHEIGMICYVHEIMLWCADMIRIACPHPFQTFPCPCQHTWRACMWPIIRKYARAIHFTHTITNNAMRLNNKCAWATHFAQPPSQHYIADIIDH